jgi:hypothetical protein
MDEQLDTAIDAVAREMTAAQPPLALRAEILARIERERIGRSAGLLLPRWAWAGGVAVLVVSVGITAWLVRTVPAPGAGQMASTDTPAATNASPTTSLPSTPAATGASPVLDATTASAQPVTLPTARPRASRPAVVPAQRVGLPDDAGPSPLAGPDAIDIAPLGPAAIAIPALGVSALGTIEPLTVSTIGPGSPEPQRRDRE